MRVVGHFVLLASVGAQDCDCSWTHGGSSCGGDDGSHCWSVCCGGTPSPTPGPPSPPSPGGAVEYCPDPAEDFQVEVEPGASGQVQWSESGWTITGQRRVSSKASFDLSGGGAEWDFDLGGAHSGVNTNFYVTYPWETNCGLNCYCDSGGNHDSQGRGCAEMDWTENNGGCYQATTWHDPSDGSDLGGYGGEGGISSTPHGSVKYSDDGSSIQINIGGNGYSGDGQTGDMKSKGAVIYASQWQGWVPGDCGGWGDLSSSVVTVRNLKITGRVVNGPEPKRCHPLPPPTPPPTPTPTPTPTPGPTDCPGGSLGACIAECPSDPAAAFQVCVKVCQQRCPSFALV